MQLNRKRFTILLILSAICSSFFVSPVNAQGQIQTIGIDLNPSIVQEGKLVTVLVVVVNKDDVKHARDEWVTVDFSGGGRGSMGIVLGPTTVTVNPGEQKDVTFSFTIPVTGQGGMYTATEHPGGLNHDGTITPAPPSSTPPKSGCLIATATYGSELATQVQMLREIRDKSLLKTTSGSRFMTGFNSFYYFFSPTVADWERENPVFKEAVKTTITPLLTTLSILKYVPIHSEAEMLFYGIGVILLNIGIYFVAPATVIIKLRHKF